MNEKEIRKLVKIVEESNISELEVSRWGKKVRIIKAQANSNHTISALTVPVTKEAVAPVQPLEVSKPPQLAASEAPAVAAAKIEVAEIRSPMVGTFYRAPAPGAEPYVEVNNRIVKGKVLCIIEAMKLMNEIEAEVSGTIIEILVENAQPVEYNQLLFKVAVG